MKILSGQLRTTNSRTFLGKSLNYLQTEINKLREERKSSFNTFYMSTINLHYENINYIHFSAKTAE